MSRLLTVVALAAVGWLIPLTALALPLLMVVAPIDGYVVEDDEVDVYGGVFTASSSVSSGNAISVTVNGAAAHVQGGRFLLSGVRLTLGSNTLEIKAADRDGTSVRIVKVWSTGPA